MSSPTQSPTSITRVCASIDPPPPPVSAEQQQQQEQVVPLPAVPRKFPAPCWTQEETLALINAYQDKWYSLRRRNLRTADWEAVAEEVTRRCPDQSPPKTSAQCRHKMEKLRKRYRTEKQRFLSLPNNRFFGSSWVFFDLIDAMEIGSGGSTVTTTAANNNNINNNNNNNNNNSNNQQMSMNGVTKVDLEQKPPMIMNIKGGNNSNDNKGDLGKYFDEILMSMGGNNHKGKSQNHEFDHGRGISPAPHIKFKVKHHHNQHNFGDSNNDFDQGGDYSGGRGFPPSGFKRKSSNYDEMKMMPLNGSSSRKDSGSGLGSKSRGKDTVVGEMVASIKMLGDGLVKMETMKMEMMRDIEQMRMEMEMKRSEMILESQHLIVNAFVEGLKKHKKVKVMEVE